METILILISSLLALISPIVYIRAILKGEAKPHRTTRLVLLIVTALATISLLIQQDKVAVWLAGVSILQSIFVFILSIKYGMGGWGKIDILCLMIALLGIIFWQTTKQPIIALFASIMADFTGMVPALIKTYKFPETEIWTFFILDAVAGTLSFFAVKSFTIEQIAYPIYIAVINLVMVIFILRPKFFRGKCC